MAHQLNAASEMYETAGIKVVFDTGHVLWCPPPSKPEESGTWLTYTLQEIDKSTAELVSR